MQQIIQPLEPPELAGRSLGIGVHHSKQHPLPFKRTETVSYTGSNNRSPGPVPIRRFAHFLKNWWLELRDWFLFVLALIAIFVMLLPHQDKPLPQWPYHMSVNCFISILVVIQKQRYCLLLLKVLVNI